MSSIHHISTFQKSAMLGQVKKAKLLDCAVIGAGPAGLTAAIYLKRFLRSVCVFGSGRSRAEWISKTKNLIGYDKGISGPELLSRLKNQTQELNVPIEQSLATVHP